VSVEKEYEVDWDEDDEVGLRAITRHHASCCHSGGYGERRRYELRFAESSRTPAHSPHTSRPL
jgi:hypothetical protein